MTGARPWEGNIIPYLGIDANIGGAGVRYLLSEEDGVNFRLDFAAGNDDNPGFYIGIGEAF